ncbi:peptidase inhibitor family I36 protein [Paenibacillus crassostreae]|uniref:Uncharacterized protein n=1 Tax=Paenibacillus crassostreae TaxID=1763538 RepID=A0A167ASX4_9BACL|nr:peptidase inhibitor family I36 protein [Paenibacillus crassostreae]AOZ93701.1 hypothetical protein LPB68_16870 [Paenibacillus crassostreae]OAB71395.1 hypothetical protein PNBC_19740 [Paenibacillus crassostreae]
MKKVIPTQSSRLPFLTIWSDADFSGRRLRFRRNLGVRSLDVFNFNDVLSSFRFEGRSSSTLVLFEDINYQGNRRIFRGTIDVSFISNFNDTTSSFIISRSRLSTSDINRIQRRGSAPNDFAEVLGNGTTRVRKPVVKK